VQQQYLSPSFLVNRIKEKGWIWCFKAAWNVTASRIAWIFPSSRFMLTQRNKYPERILAIWDFQTVPYSIGELLVLQETTLVLRWLYKADKIDIAFVCNPNKPARYDMGLNSYNYHYHLSALIPVLQVNPSLGSFFMFDSYKQLERFVVDNVDQYHVWPSGKAYLARAWAYRHNFDFIQKFYRKNKFIPHLSCRQITLDWASWFIKEHIPPDIAVTVHLRNNPLMDDSINRNANIEEWLKFFEHCDGRFPVKFVVISAHDEIDDRLRNYSNVVIAKDFHTTIEQDLALIQASAMFMGGPSGPATMAWFSDLPYLIFNYSPINETLKWESQFVFANSLQRLVWKPETASLLINEFSELYERIDISVWRDRFKETVDFPTSQFYLR
jgi:hypothetical protein